MVTDCTKCLTPEYPVSGTFAALFALDRLHNGPSKPDTKFEVASKFVKKAKEKSIHFQSKDPIFKRYTSTRV